MRIALLIALFAAAACSLDWDYPDTTAPTGGAPTGGTTSTGGTGGMMSAGGGGQTDVGSGGSEDGPCCRVCQAITLPAACTGFELDKPYESGCPVVGWAHEVDMCFEYRACNCDNCDLLPRTEQDCMDLVHTQCNDCMLDSAD